MKKIIFYIISLFVLCSFNSFSQGTLYDMNGEKMRGAPMVLAKNLPESVAFARDINNWYSLKDNGINTVRLCWVDPWYRDYGYDYWSPAEVRPHIDKCVENANTAGMNIIINYHNIDEQGVNRWYYNFTPVNQFWGEIAWRYANNPRVYYELANEPTFNGNDYTNPNFKSGLVGLYNQVRQAAPNRHIMMFSYNSLGHDITNITYSYSEIDWTNASVAFHSYSEPTSSWKIQELMQNYRVICTEWDYPGSYDYVNPIDGYWINGETWERLGVSWVDWRDWDDNSFNKLYNTFIPHAQANGYWWGGGGNGGSPLQEGTYRLYCKWGDLMLSGNSGNWSNVQLGPLNTSWTSQMWELEVVSGNTYRLKNKWTGLYLNGNQAAWTDVNSGPLNNSYTSMQWTLEDAGNSNYRLRCNWGDKYLSGSNAPWATAKNGPLNTSWTSQMWYIEPVSGQRSDQEADLNINIFPNPSSTGNFNVHISGDDIDESEKMVRIFTPDGKEVFSKTLLYIDRISTNLSPGIYFMQVQLGESIYTEKIVVY